MRLIAITITVLAAAGFAESANADDTPERSPELQVLERFIGTWDSVVTNETTGAETSTIEERRWSRKGQFVLSEDFDRLTKKEAHFLMTYDPNAKVYRTCFITEGSVAIILGTWDEDNDTMTWSGTDSAGNRLSGKSRFIVKDHVEWSMVFMNLAGKVVSELDTKQSRRKT